MPISSEHLFIASMDVDPDREALFNEVYDQEHIPNISKVPGVLSTARLIQQELIFMIGGERKIVRIENEPKYAALYELESPEVLTSEAWAKAVESGRWPEEVRPYTRNRRHVLMKRI